MALRNAARAIVLALALAGPFGVAADAAGRTVAIQGFAFPALTITVGDTVTWQNLVDGAPHTATSDAGAFDTGPILPGTSSKAVPFVAAGTYAYHCMIHSTMHGTITVQAAATAAPTPAPTPPQTVAPTPPPTASPSASPSPAPSATASPTPAPATGTPITVPTSVAVASLGATSRPGSDVGTGPGPGPVIAAAALVLALGLGGLAFYLYRRR
jgi:plastocyanin